MIARTEYFPTTDEAQSPHKKIFRLERAEDETTKQIVSARTEVLMDAELMPEAVRLFCYLLDLAVQVKTYLVFGCVCISERALAHDLHVSKRTIWNWLYGRTACGRLGLVIRDFVWVGSDFVSNMWPRNVYHIRKLSPKPDKIKRDDGAHYGNGKVRGKPPMGQGARRPGEPFLPGLHVPSVTLYGPSGQPLPPSQSSQVVDVAAESGNIFRLRAEKFCGSQPQYTAAQSRNALRLRAATDCGSEPKRVAAESGNGLRLRAETGGEHKEAKVEAEASLEGGEPPQKNGDWERNLKKLFPDELRALKADLLREQKRLEPGQPEIADLSCRIEAIDRQLYGGALPKRPAAPIRPAKPQPPREPTADELLEGARYLVSVGKSALLTTAQKQALHRAGATA